MLRDPHGLPAVDAEAVDEHVGPRGRVGGRLQGVDPGVEGQDAQVAQGRVVAVTIAEAPRRGRIYTTAPDTFGPAIRGIQRADEPTLSEAFTVDNYGRLSDDLRRDLRVAQVVCLSA